ncbi:LOW QUALITY PROTEIN: putative protease Do-like 14 [Manihot esculenta]|uniref:LOW QUALITY PROTEIN: putative protease Do-like 14 n=1 Tax=Manihot esculenta TaxID=3983 RepID=UPI001CC4BBCA|nr:LOW QUALITY PROTEIN: putative protease Do-like 14 [Manihot esculenta]
MGRNSVADDVKVVAHLSNGNSFDCQILAFGFHYYIAALKIQSESDAPLPTACLAHLDDSISVDPNQLYIPEEKPFQLCPHSKSFNLIPGDTLIALGRYFIKPYDVMATIGEFSLNRCEYDCKELLRVNCQITRVVAHLSNGNSFDCQILAFDFHYNIAALKIQSESDAPLPTACLAHLDDSISVDPNQLYIPEEKPFQLLPHSKSFNLIPGDTLIVLGRYFIKPYDVMATIGEFSVTLLRVNCQITRCGIGGPFINYYGEVIGICFHDLGFTPFLPINVASKWWEHYKRCGEPAPWLGMEVTNLYAADVNILEKIIQKFPNVFKGVIVEEVMAGSSADSAGISPNDVIVQFGGKTIKSFLELFEAMWDKVGDPVEVIVIPASNSVPLRLSMVVDEATSNNLYSWPLWEHAR